MRVDWDDLMRGRPAELDGSARRPEPRRWSTYAVASDDLTLAFEFDYGVPEALHSVTLAESSSDVWVTLYAGTRQEADGAMRSPGGYTYAAVGLASVAIIRLNEALGRRRVLDGAKAHHYGVDAPPEGQLAPLLTHP